LSFRRRDPILVSINAWRERVADLLSRSLPLATHPFGAMPHLTAAPLLSLPRATGSVHTVDVRVDGPASCQYTSTC
jgi:hypothetical protein